jgi:hypothetical protein
VPCNEVVSFAEAAQDAELMVLGNTGVTAPAINGINVLVAYGTFG